MMRMLQLPEYSPPTWISWIHSYSTLVHSATGRKLPGYQQGEAVKWCHHFLFPVYPLLSGIQVHGQECALYLRFLSKGQALFPILDLLLFANRYMLYTVSSYIYVHLLSHSTGTNTSLSHCTFPSQTACQSSTLHAHVQICNIPRHHYTNSTSGDEIMYCT